MTEAAAVTPQPGAAPAAAPASGALSPDAFSRLDISEHHRYSQIKRADGNGSEWVLRDSLPPDTPEPAKAGESTDAIDPAKMGAERIRLVGKDGVVFDLDAADITRLMEQHATETLRKASLPPDASAYEPKLPESFKPPPGVDLKIDAADPALQDLKMWAHKRGLTQAEFSDVLGIYAAREARQSAVMNAAAARELEKMGPHAAQRVDAIAQFLRGALGDDLARPMLNVLATEKIARGWEKLIQRFATQGHAPFSAAHREPGDAPGRVDDATYAKMSPGDKWDYSRQFDQKQFGHAAGAFSGER
jgi:hypothetical protein